MAPFRHFQLWTLHIGKSPHISVTFLRVTVAEKRKFPFNECSLCALLLSSHRIPVGYTCPQFTEGETESRRQPAKGTSWWVGELSP